MLRKSTKRQADAMGLLRARWHSIPGTASAASGREAMEDWTGAPLSKPPEVILPSVCAVALDASGRLLLHRRSDNGLWGLPGGKVDPGESVSAAVAREVLEETGFRV